MDVDALKESFVDTYSTASEASVHELVEQYETAQAYLASRPNAGSTAVARALGVPRGRVRPWVDDGAMPDAYRGWSTVVSRGWHRLEGERHRAITRLVAGVFAGGAISQPSYVPTWSVGDEQEYEHLLDVFQQAGVQPRRRDRGGHRGTTVEPRSNQSVFGRLLAARGAPVGSDLEGLTIPDYLFEESQADAAAAFCGTYLTLRGVDRPGKGLIQIHEKGRPSAYHDDLTVLFEQTYGAHVRRHRYGVFVDRDRHR